MEAPLLSRFDLVFDLSDAHSAAHDAAVCDAVLADAAAEGGGGGGGGGGGRSRPPPPPPPSLPPWSPADLRAYAAWLASPAAPPAPSLSPAAERVLLAAYRARRRDAAAADGAPGGATTLRALESLARLTVAHARLLGRGEAGEGDAVAAVVLTAASGAPGARVAGVAAVDPATARFDGDADAQGAADAAAVRALVEREEGRAGGALPAPPAQAAPPPP